MAGTYTNLLCHIIFSTKDREPRIESKLAPDLYAYIGGTVRNEGGRLIEAGGTTDHVHLLALLPPAVSVSDMLRKIKANSSNWMNEDNQQAPPFAWQAGYGAFAVSESAKNDVIAYIANQDEHHRHRSFKEEFLDFLRKHNVEYDERYIWE